MKKIIDWFKYPSSQAAIVAVLAAAGVSVNPEHLEQIVSGALALIGFFLGYKSDVDVKTEKK